ncbi:ABC transporter ATP-binding protein [Lagierella sp.]|uniref:ABC transporter ATP-binding protein n=1 Tax=Lagierella sp. TaxID=2849657 RepID=UPI00261E8503|nr:ABC transporter ATP-binding protein [Lagierella sp.]
MFLEIINLKKKYKDKYALKDVSFTCDEKSILCLLGPSGCGKTTILQCIGGFTEITEGDIKIQGRSIVNIPAEDRPIATVFQSLGLFPHMTVLENITYGLKFRKVSKKARIEEGRQMLKLLNLEGYDNKKVTDLSGGEQQRVAIGRALIVKPKILLLDEPFSNLDTKLRESLRMELLRIRDIFGITIIFVTHDQEDAFTIADDIILMNKGVIEQKGTGREIYNHPKTKFSMEFVGRSNKIDENHFNRPERIIEDENGVEVTVKSKIFKGAFIEYSLDYKDKDYKMVKLNDEKELQIGDRIRVKLPKNKI